MYDLAATAVSKSCTHKLREGGISARMHTDPESCTRRNCMYVAVMVLLRHMSHPVSVWGNPPALKNFSMWGHQCRELMDKTLAWAQVKGIGWGFPYMGPLKETKPVAHSEGGIVEHTLDPWISQLMQPFLAKQGSGERYGLGLSIHESLERNQNSGPE